MDRWQIIFRASSGHHDLQKVLDLIEEGIGPIEIIT